MKIQFQLPKDPPESFYGMLALFGVPKDKIQFLGEDDEDKEVVIERLVHVPEPFMLSSILGEGCGKYKVYPSEGVIRGFRSSVERPGALEIKLSAEGLLPKHIIQHKDRTAWLYLPMLLASEFLPNRPPDHTVGFKSNDPHNFSLVNLKWIPLEEEPKRRASLVRKYHAIRNASLKVTSGAERKSSKDLIEEAVKKALDSDPIVFPIVEMYEGK